MMARRDDHDAMLGAYALDAVDADERAEIEAYLAQTPEARAEVDRYHAAIVALADDELQPAPLPAGLWDRLSTAMFSDDATETGAGTANPPPALPKLSALPGGRSDQAAAVEPAATPDRAAADRATAAAAADRADAADRMRAPSPRRRRRRLQPAALALAAAAITVLTLGGLLVRQQQRINDQSVPAAAKRALGDTRSKVGTLAGPDSAGPQVRAVVDQAGNGYLFAEALQPLPAGRTYQLWTLDGGTPVSLGILGARPGVIRFPAAGQPTTLAITAEDLPGVATPTQAPLVSGSVS